MRLYPELPVSVAATLAATLAAKSPRELARNAELTHPSVIYQPIGGNKVSVAELGKLRSALREAAGQCGYPKSALRVDHYSFDIAAAKVLYEIMDISPWSASHQGIWQFVSCVLVPDLVRWRFPGDDGSFTKKERFMGSIRNTFRRLWWRAFTLTDPVEDGPSYGLLDELREDELVQLSERPTLFGCRRLTRSLCRAFLETAKKKQCNRMELMRDVQKRLMRIFPIISLETLREEELNACVQGALEASLAHIATSSKV